jgi:hypothetical protein
MDNPSPQDAQRRLRELRGIAENKRTDAEWDEINELEIVLAQGNQKSADRPAFAHGNPRSADRKPGGDRQGFQKRSGQPPRRKR